MASKTTLALRHDEVADGSTLLNYQSVDVSGVGVALDKVAGDGIIRQAPTVPRKGNMNLHEALLNKTAQLALMGEALPRLYAQIQDVTAHRTASAGLPEAAEGCYAAATGEEGAWRRGIDGQLEGNGAGDADENVTLTAIRGDKVIGRADWRVEETTADARPHNSVCRSKSVAEVVLGPRYG
jgi:hypothetical protein